MIDVIGPTDIDFGHPVVPWDGEAFVQLLNGGPMVIPEHFTLVRLGSVTHSIDMDQRWMRLEITGGSESTKVSDGQYVKVGPGTSRFSHARQIPL